MVYWMLAGLTTFVATLFSPSIVQAQEKIFAEISAQKDASHLEFSGTKNWDYDISKSNGQIKISIPELTEAAIVRLQTFRDQHVKSIKVEKADLPGRHWVWFKLANNVDAFDYQTDEPSKLIIDFYQPNQDKPVTVETGALKALPQKIVKPKIGAKKTGRKPASELSPVLVTDHKEEEPLLKGVYDGEDINFNRFRLKDYDIKEESIIQSRQNIYLPFPMLKMPISQFNQQLNSENLKTLPEGDEKEDQEAQLLVKLFAKNRNLLFKKAYKYFTEKYPYSKYDEQVRNMAAHMYMQDWVKDGKIEDYLIAKQIYAYLLEKYPGSPNREKIQLILAYALLDRNEGLATLQAFQDFIAQHPKSEHVINARKAIAEALLNLKKFDETTDTYKKIHNDFVNTQDGMEAYSRLGDVAFIKQDFQEAIKSYKETLKKYPDAEKKFPNLHYNMAESYFWTKQYKEALDQHIQFLNNFPSDEYGGYSITRIGEILDIMGADKQKITNAFLESYFRYPETPGGKIARIRFLNLKMQDMKEKELRRSVEEIKKIVNSVQLPGMAEFSSLILADGMQKRGEYNQAAEALLGYYQKNPNSANLKTFKARILRNLSAEIEQKVKEGNFLDALKFYSKYSQNWLYKNDRIDVDYNVARAYELAGALPEADRIYEKTLERRVKIKGTEDEKERRVNESLPSIDTLRLRIAATDMKDRKYTDAYKKINEIKVDQLPNETERSEAVQIQAALAEERNEYDVAEKKLRDLIKTWKGDSEKMMPIHNRLAKVLLKMNKNIEAELEANQVREYCLNKKCDKLWLKDAYETKGVALEKQKRNLAALENYQEFLEKHESDFGLYSTRYRAGELLYEKGDLKAARNMWSRLQGGNGEMYWKIAQEKLQHAEWQDEYKKYIKRVPAMTHLQGAGND